MNKVSIIIPARNEKYLEKTIRNVLENATGDIEIIAILDGYIPDPQIVLNDDRVIFIHNEVAIGQRPAINQGARMAKGNYIMKLDAHCAVGKGFDEILVRDCEYDMTMIPQMYNLDVITWTPKLIDNYKEAVRQGKVNPYMFIGKQDGRLRTLYYNKNDKKRLDLGRQNIMIDETMSCMGCCFFMHKDRYWELGGCDEGHGHWGQQGIEVACKAWLSGGRLMVNKNTWFAHFFRGGGVPEGEQRGAPWPGFTQEMVDKARDYSEDLWLNDKWPKAVHKFDWLLKKFNPPTWEKIYDCEKEYYDHFFKKGNIPNWFGHEIVKYPGDIMLYQEAIFAKKPDVIVETGTYKGGSALFFANMFDLLGKGEVITIDKEDFNPPKHPRITHIVGRATEENTINKVKELCKGKSVMVILDSDHSRSFVKRELGRYKNIVSSGQYMVVEDTNLGKWEKGGPDEAVEWFMKDNEAFEREDNGSKYLFTISPNSWLLKK